MKRGKFMICKNCSTNYDDNAPYYPYCGAPNDMAHGSQQSQNEYYNPNAQQGGQYYTTVSRIRSNLIINISSRI